MQYRTHKPLARFLQVVLTILVVFTPFFADVTDVAYAQDSGEAGLAAPGLSATAGVGEIALSWTVVDGASHYELWVWDESNDWRRIGGELTGASYRHAGLTVGVTYYYQMRALDGSGGKSSWSEQVSAAPSALAAPGLVATAGVGEIALSWTVVDGASHYELWVWDEGNDWGRIGGELTDTSYRHEGLTVGVTYYYQMRAVDGSGGKSSWSEQVSAAPSALAAPGLSATAGVGEIALSWTVVDGASHYELWVWDEGNDWGRIGGELTGVSYRHAGLTVGVTYYYQMRAVDGSGGKGSWSEQVSATPGAPPTPTPTGTGTQAGETSTPTPTSTAVQAEAVLATDAQSEAAPTPASTGTGTQAPTAKPALRAEVAGATSIRLTWGAVPGATVYALWRREAAGSWSRIGGNLTGTSYTDSGLTAGTTYNYAVRGANAGGSGPWSDTVTITLTSGGLVAPTAKPALRAEVAGATSIRLTWGAVPRATVYALWRREAAGSWSRIGGNLTGTSYTDSGLTAETTYNYAVRGANAAGVGPWSDTVTIKLRSPSSGGRVASKDIDLAAENSQPYGIWSDGTTMWVLNWQGNKKLYAYTLASGARVAARDIDLASWNYDPTNIWSDGTTIWVWDYGDGKFYAYTLASGARASARDIDLANADSEGFWSDGTTMWVADHKDKKLYAYMLASGARVPARDIDLAAENDRASGIWSDGTTMWVADLRDDKKLYAYTLASGGRVSTRDIDLAAENALPFGIWSDGTTIWVADGEDAKLYAYTLTTDPGDDDLPPTAKPALRAEVAGATSIRLTWGAVPGATVYALWRREAAGSWSRIGGNLTGTSYTDSGLTAGTTYNYAVRGANAGGSGPWSDTVTITLTSGGLVAPTAKPALRAEVAGATSIRLTWGAVPRATVYALWRREAAGSWSRIGGNLTGTSYTDSGLTAETTYNYAVRGANAAGVGPWSDTVTITLTSVAYAPLPPPTAKPALRAEVAGATSIRLTWGAVPGATSYRLWRREAASSGTAQRFDITGTSYTDSGLTPGKTYEYSMYSSNAAGVGPWSDTVTIKLRSPSSGGRVASKDIDLAAENSQPYGIWSDGTTMWVLNWQGNKKLYAYTLASGVRASARDIDLTSWNYDPTSIWSDGTTMWVWDYGVDKFYAYTLASGARASARDIDLGNADSEGFWSDGTTMWVADHKDKKLYAYTLASGARVPARDIDLAAENDRASGIWSDGTTMWVADLRDDKKLYAYTLASGGRVSTRDINLAAENALPFGIWSDRTTIWVADGEDAKLYAYTLTTDPGDNDLPPTAKPALRAEVAGATSIRLTWGAVPRATSYRLRRWDGATAQRFDITGTSYTDSGLTPGKTYEYSMYSSNAAGVGPWSDTVTIKLRSPSIGGRVASKDIDLAAENSQPYGIWSDGTTMWVLNWQGNKKLYAYTLASGVRVAARDIDLTSWNYDPTQIWSDGTTMWVWDYGVDKLYAYTLASGARASARDIDLGNADSYDGFWSDGTTMWVADHKDKKLYAYTLASGARVAARDIDLAAENDRASGIWSDGTTMWVADLRDDKKLYAYTLASGGRVSTRDINLAAENALPFGIWSDRTTIWVADGEDAKLYAYTLTTDPGDNDLPPTAKPALRAEVAGATSIRLTWGAVPRATSYRLRRWDGATAQRFDITGTSYTDSGLTPGKTYEYSMYSSNAAGVGPWSDTVTIKLRSPSIGGRVASKDIDLAAENSQPYGIWSDGTTMWVLNWQGNKKLYAYTLASGVRVAARDIDLTSWNYDPTQIWSDGTTMWVWDYGVDKLYAYTLASGARASARDIDLGNADSYDGFWSDGTTMWVADHKDKKLYAYTLASGARVAARDIDLAAENDRASGIWSDGTTMWVADLRDDKKLYAYTLASGGRVSTRDINLAAENALPFGIWSDRTTIWVADGEDAKLYAYTLTTDPGDNDLPPTAKPALRAEVAGATSIRLTWGAVPRATSYRLRRWDGATAQRFDITGTSYTDSGLTPGKTYEYSMYSSNAAGVGPWSDTVTIKLEDVAPTAKPALRAEVAGATSIRLTWGAVPRATSYRLRRWDGATAQRFDIIGTSYTDSGLTPGKTYEYLMYSSNAAGVGPWSDTVTIKLEDVAPTAKPALRAEVAGATSIRLTWGAVPRATSYRLRRWDGATAQRFDITGTSYTDSGLTPGKTYEYLMYSSNAAGVGPWSDTVTIKLPSPSIGGRVASKDIDLASANNSSWGIWSDGTTMWVSDVGDDKLYAYTLATGAWADDREFDLAAANGLPYGIWSDGTTMWVADRSDDKLYAYTLTSGVRVWAKEFDLAAENSQPRGIWSDGTTMWVADYYDEKLYAYTLASGGRVSTRDIDLAAENAHPYGIWSDNTTMWVADYRDDKFYAYTLASGVRVRAKEFDLAAANAHPMGIWSDGATMWVADSSDDKLYAYRLN